MDEVNRYLFNPTLVRLSRWTSLWNKCRIIRLILEMMSPKQEVVPRVLDDESEIFFHEQS